MLSSVPLGTTVISRYLSVYVERMFSSVVAYRVPVIFGNLGSEGRLLGQVRQVLGSHPANGAPVDDLRTTVLNGPVTDSAVPFLTSATVRAPAQLVVRMSRSAVATLLPMIAGGHSPSWRGSACSTNRWTCRRPAVPSHGRSCPACDLGSFLEDLDHSIGEAGLVRRFSAVVVILTAPAPILLGCGSSFPFREASTGDVRGRAAKFDLGPAMGAADGGDGLPR
jgi:hypothetical protein